MFTVDLLETWSQRLCGMVSGGRAEGAALLELSPNLEHRKDYAIVQPPPPGTKSVMIVDDIPGRTVVDHVELELVSPAMTLAAIEATFGEGKPSVRVHATSAFKRWYHVEVDGAPNTSEIYASFPNDPTADTEATTISLRRNPRS